MVVLAIYCIAAIRLAGFSSVVGSELLSNKNCLDNPNKRFHSVMNVVNFHKLDSLSSTPKQEKEEQKRAQGAYCFGL